MFTDAILVNIKAAKNLRNVDMFSESDPYAKLIVKPSEGLICNEETEKYKTKTIKNNLNPEWNETVSIVLDPIVDAVFIEVKSEKTGINPHLGETFLPISRETPFRPTESWYLINEKHDSHILIEQTYIPMTLASSFADRLDSLKTRLNDAEADDLSDEERIAQLSTEVETLSMEKESQNQKIEQLQGEVTEKNEQIEEMHNAIEEVQKDIEEFTEQLEQLAEEKQAIEEALKKEEEEGDKLEEENAQLRAERNELKDEIATLKEENDEAEQEAERQRRLEEEAQREAEKARKEAERAQRELEQKRKDPLDLKEKGRAIAEQGKKFGRMFRRR